MKKALLILGGVMLLTLGAVGLASANAGPHGSYTETTDKCAACHRAHTAVGADLLRASDANALCEMCHKGGAGAGTDPYNGLRVSNNARLNGGGFEYMGGTTNSFGTVVASSHTVGVVGTAWGGASSGTGVSGALECTSCHNPHGSTNYRILRDADNGYPYGAGNAIKHRWVANNSELLDWASGQVVEANQPSDYSKYAPGADQNDWNALTNTYYTQGINSFCATCHKQYLTYSGSASNNSMSGTTWYANGGTQNANDGNGDVARYRHAVSRVWTYDPQGGLSKIIRFAVTDTTQTKRWGFTCLSCHFAHGTSAQATGYASGVQPAGDSANLFYDNRGVCRSCHQKTK